MPEVKELMFHQVGMLPTGDICVHTVVHTGKWKKSAQTLDRYVKTVYLFY